MIRVVALVLAAVLAAGAAPAQQIDTLALRGHSFFLAHDLLEGRDTGSRGERLAAAYIMSQLKRLGVPGAAPDGGYLQAVPLREATIDHAATRVVVRRGARADSFRSGEHFVLNTGGARAFRDVDADALLAGTGGLAAAALEHRPDLSGQAIVLFGSLGAEATSLIPDWIRRGAAAIVYLVPDAAQFRFIARSRGDTRLFVAAELDDPVWQPDIPVLVAGPELSGALLADAPLPPDALGGRRPFAALPLERRIEASIRVETRDIAAHNVAALLPGRDPALRHEVVAYTAHYDHLGIGEPDAHGDSIYNGFSDNAAGVAMLLAIADAFSRQPPARSVLFLFFTGEERGLLGSSFYAAAPLVPLDRTAAVINLDAGAPPAPPRSWRIAGGAESTLGEIAGRVAARHGWLAEPGGAAPNSDYWPFLRRGVPAVFLIPGRDWDGVGAAQREQLRRRWDRYHQPNDEWAADFPFAGLERYAAFALALGREVADSSDRPRSLR